MQQGKLSAFAPSLGLTMASTSLSPTGGARRFWRSVPTSINLLAIGSVLALGVKIFGLNQVPEIFPGGQSAGLVVEAVLASILASYVFYLIVVHRKEVDDQAAIYPFVQKHSQRIVGRCSGLLAEIQNASGVPLDIATLTKDGLRSAFEKIDPNADAPLVFSLGVHAKWFQYLLHHVHETKDSIDKLLTQMKFLDASLASLLAEMDDSSHFHVVRAVNTHSAQGVRNKDMTVFTDNLFEHVLTCRRLESIT